MPESKNLWNPLLCNESAHLGSDSNSWPWRDWATIRAQLVDYLQQPADFFRQLAVRRHFLWLLKWFSTRPADNLVRTCPLGVLTLRIFTVLLSNDADRCIQLRDARLGLELLQMPFADVAASGWPVFNMLARLAEETRRVSFPLHSACDELDSDGGHFRAALSRALVEETRLPAAEALRYMSAAGQKCAFGLASARFTLASVRRGVPPGSPDKLAGGDPAEARVHAEAHELMEEGQQLLSQWTPLRRSLYDLVTTRWPLWRVLDRSSTAGAGGFEPPYRRSAPASVWVELVFCGLGWRSLEREAGSFAEARGWRLHLLRADPGACARFYQTVALLLRPEALVVVLSPWLLAWDSQVEAALDSGVGLVFESTELDVVGFPTLDGSNTWTFNVWRVALTDWALDVSAFPTGYAETSGDRCFRCDATSGTRVFRSAVLWRGLITRLRGRAAEMPENLGSWLVDLDIQARMAGSRVYTCMAPPPREVSYLETASLTPALAVRYGLERAHFTATNRQTRCLAAPEWRLIRAASPLPSSSWSTRVSAPPCAVREAREALAFVSHQWPSYAAAAAAPAGHSPELSSWAAVWQLLVYGPAAGLVTGQPLPVKACHSNWFRGEPPPPPATSPPRPPALPATLLAYPLDPARGEGLTLASRRLNETLLEMELCDCDATIQKEQEQPLRLLLPESPVELHLPPWEEDVATPGLRRAPSAEVEVEVILCTSKGEAVSGLEALAGERGWIPHSLLTENISECSEFLRQQAERLSGKGTAVLLSPWLRSWSAKTGALLQRGMELLHNHSTAAVYGFPLIGEGRLWQWTPRRLRHQYWKLEYAPLVWSADDIKGAASKPLCTIADASSGSRIFRSSEELRSLLRDALVDPENPHNWLADLDLQAKQLGLDMLTCAETGLPEDDYLLHTTLSRALAERHQVEAMRLLDKHDEHCLPGSNWFAVAQRGLVAPWCFRRDVQRSFRAVHKWWISQDPANFVVPEEGTFLALFRNGAAGILPWDSDFDVKLYSEREDMSITAFMNLTQAPAFKSLGLEAYAYDGCGQDNYVLLRRANITHHIGDAYLRGGQRKAEHPWQADLFGVKVRLGPEHMEHIFFTRYRTPVQKLFGADGLPLQCLQRGHNACLPDCRDPAVPCEFRDGFVHVDDPVWWKTSETGES